MKKDIYLGTLYGYKMILKDVDELIAKDVEESAARFFKTREEAYRKLNDDETNREAEDLFNLRNL